MEIELYDTVVTNDGNIVRLVEAIFSRALQLGASDIHIEPLEDYARVRLRIDGLLTELCRLPIVRHNAVLSRIKLLSEMDIAEKRLPQDGRLAANFQGRAIDFRVASLPTIEGEKLAIRILDKHKDTMDLDKLGFSESNLERYKKLIHAANGLILLSGPTGSGKTTTLYATLREINSMEKNIITLENPIEYKLAGINQIAIQEKIGMTFAKGLRAIVRQDPNIIMLGEIRDEETARIAVQAALTGHLVFSTLHTNSALDAIARLVDMGIEPFLLLSALRGVLAQRLVRKQCEACVEEYVASSFEKECLAKNPTELLKLTRNTGCRACRETGYRGRLALQELIIMDDKLRSLCLKQENKSQCLQYLRENGFKSLREDGIAKVLAGKTTLAELNRIAVL